MTSTTEIDYYKVLSVSRSANSKQIKKAYHSLALEHHPDKNSDTDGTRFKAILEAYEMLSDPLKKSIHDRSHGSTEIPPRTSQSVWDQAYADAWDLRDAQQPPTTAQEHAHRYYRQTYYGEPSPRRSYFPPSRSVSPDRVSNCSSNNSETRAASNNPETRRGYVPESGFDQETGFRSQERPFEDRGAPSRTSFSTSPQERTPSGASSTESAQPPERHEQAQQGSYGVEVDSVPEWEVATILDVPPRRSSFERDAEPNLVKAVIGHVDLIVMATKRRWFFFPSKTSFEVTLERPGHETKTFVIPTSIARNFGIYDYWYENEKLGVLDEL
ncbi:molecular chaperone DnaJ [Venturia nashicola]|uniref:Molecular chaperone DnaJ n=1 Tax=Venturia nashicola TaxID=86259 RepID=A0A4Z1NPU0_9PEZI|nr:molecular chaperone DnaJ [Venturia nashicola]TLD21019.1 molecular chaperone DnaJ [Venturia nashicola]